MKFIQELFLRINLPCNNCFLFYIIISFISSNCGINNESKTTKNNLIACPYFIDWLRTYDSTIIVHQPIIVSNKNNVIMEYYGSNVFFEGRVTNSNLRVGKWKGTVNKHEFLNTSFIVGHDSMSHIMHVLIRNRKDSILRETFFSYPF